MKLSTRTRYGTRAMLYLAPSYEKGPISIKEIADHQQLSPKYLETLMATLRAAGLVRSARGAQGGHMLARPPDQITLRQIYTALEGPEKLVDCTADPQVCDRSGTCVTLEVWAQLYDACMEVLESITLEDLAHRAREKQGLSAIMYHI